MVSHPNSSLNPQKSDDGCVEHCERAKKTKTVFGYLSALAPLQLDLDAPHRVRKTTSPLSHLLSDTSHTVSPWSMPTPTPTPTSQRHPFASAWFGYASKETNSRALLLSRPNVRPNVRPSERKTLRRRARARHSRHRRRHHRRRDRSVESHRLPRAPAGPTTSAERGAARATPGVDAFDPGPRNAGVSYTRVSIELHIILSIVLKY